MVGNRLSTLVALLVAAGCHAAQAAGEPEQGPRLVIGAQASPKLAPELVAAKLSGGRLLGRTPDGQAIVQTVQATAAEAIAAFSDIAEVAISDLPVPEDFEEIHELIVAYEPGQIPAEAAMMQVGLQTVEQHEPGAFVVVRTVDGVTAAALQAMEDDPAIRYVEPNYRYELILPPEEGVAAAEEATAEGEIRPTFVPNDPKFGSLWGMLNIRAPQAWNTVTATPVIVGVIDTGVRYDHPDLKANMWKNPGEVPGNNKDDDHNGYVDDVYGYDFYNNDSDPKDGHSHGTHVAGTIGAVGNNNQGVAGVCWGVKIMAIEIFSASGGYAGAAKVAKAIDYATNNGAKVTNNSWGGGASSKTIQEAIDRAEKKGVLFVAAAGNYNKNNDATPFYPSSYPNKNIISVMSIDKTDKKSSFSHYGKTTVDIGAPGRSIFSTIPPNSYGNMNGTSMASPHVTGAAALVWGHPQYKTASWSYVKSLLMSRARKLSDLNGKCVSGGTLNIAFLEQAVTTILTQEAYNQFRNVTVDKKKSVVSVSFTIPRTMFVHVTAQTTARLSSSSPVIVTNGLYRFNNPNAMYTYSLRRVQFDAKNDVQPLSTSFGQRLGQGRHTFYWNVWVPKGTKLLTNSGTIMIEAFGSKAGGILEIEEALLEEEPDTTEITDEGIIKTRMTVVEELDQD